MSALILRFLNHESRRLVIPDPEQRVMNSSISVLLEVPFEDPEPRFCSKCLSEQRFLMHSECAFGLVGTCLGCGDEWLRPFSRTTTTEVA